ncbi:vanadium-dependent haloperoxidase [Pararhodonellum marinum]|uniref:vanadium-dependent haloperoxidase n=1 Tax=Pararhodonellum marinum TaxID=2755358 RepID=UPI0018906BC9|nr:vanadium-dependent haloperoxidase [Pararhodonellum marinum]
MIQFRLSVLSILLAGMLVWGGCKENTAYKDAMLDSDALAQGNTQITGVIIHDIFSPPVASRIYAYANIAAYEVAVLADPQYKSMMGQLNGFEKKEFDTSKACHFPLASMTAFYEVGTSLIFSEEKMIAQQEKMFERIKKQGIPKKVFENSVALGKEVAAHVLAYASKDNYHQSRSFEKYTIRNDDNSWKPTPPAYMEGIEPHWNKIRPFLLDSANQFIPKAPTPFDIIPESEFYQEAYEVFKVGKELTKEQSDIAYFWDCNPYKMNVKGHVMFAEKKITPGGHWIGIASIASKAKGLDWKAAAETHAVTAITLFDGFISCWDEKYRSVLIRPETYINLHIDEDWLPLLQTPPFPEYTSGHSVISTAASLALGHLLGDELHLVDSTEVAYGLPIREFDSFSQAAAEAAISRFYGGIHYIPAIDNGVDQGRMVGNHVIQNIHTRQENLAANKD